jgi:hypothetical protein
MRFMAISRWGTDALYTCCGKGRVTELNKMRPSCPNVDEDGA